MKPYKITYFLFLGLIFFVGHSQKGKVRQAAKEYDNLAYIKTSEILLEVAEKGYTSVDILQKLADSFYFNNQMEDAAKWYGELMQLDPEGIDAEYYFRYAQSLKSIENYTESDEWMKRFAAVGRDDLREGHFEPSMNYLSKIEQQSRAFEVRNMELNSENSDFGTVLHNNKLIFSSARGTGKKYKWNEQPFLDLFAADKKNRGTYGNVQKLPGKINSRFHESTVTFAPDGKTMYFTRNNYFKNRAKEDKSGTNRLKIFKALLDDDGEWGNLEPVHFNDDAHSVAHPSLNKKGTKMYFASDMEGTLGSSDIFEVAVNSDGSLGIPANLGPSVNTGGNESFPFVNAEGDLYFSSNALNGLGGYDVFVIKDFENKKATGQPLVPENMGRPINSPKDDFGYYEDLETKEGFFTSNRKGGKGDDDIYTFEVRPCEQVLTGVARDAETLAVLAEAKITLYDGNGALLQQRTTGTDGTFTFENIACGKAFLVRAEKDTYTSVEKRFSTSEERQEIQMELLLEKDEKIITNGTDLAKTLDIPIIYFDFDKASIRPDAAVELQKVLAVMEKYPDMMVDIGSHTDCRATAAYNLKLSDDRAKATRNYLIANGIKAERLTAKGYGESRLINDCACEPSNASACSEAEHQKNRRSEFIVVDM